MSYIFQKAYWKEIGIAILMLSLLTLRYGYSFGTHDQVELLPYISYLQDHSLYAKDFFIQGLAAFTPNERTVFSTLLLPFANHLPIVNFILYFFTGIFLLIALKNVATLIFKEENLPFWSFHTWSWLAVFINLFFFANKGLGDCELFGNAFQAGAVSCLFLSWGIYFFLQEKYNWSVLILIIASFVHVLEGLDIMLILTGILLVKKFYYKSISWRELLLFCLPYLCTAGVYQLLIYGAKTSGKSTLDKEEFFQILFVFRHAHHFIFHCFPKSVLLLFFILSALSLWFYKVKNQTLWLFFVISLCAIFVYIICVDVLHIVFIANFQIYKICQWQKFFGVIAALCLGVPVLNNFLEKKTNFKTSQIKNGLTFLFIGLVISLLFNAFQKATYEFINLEKQPEIAICQKIKSNLPKAVLFVLPFENTAFKFHSQRDAFVEFKAIPKHQNFVGEWARRIELVYGINYKNPIKGFPLEQEANKNYEALLTSEKVQNLIAEGVSHALTKSSIKSNHCEFLFSEGSFYVYKLR